MTDSTKPYLIRAIFEWCVDQGFTPYVAAVVDGETLVPAGYARDGQIVLNLSPDATNQLQLGNDRITFQARFSGVAQAISIPTGNVVAIYARENGHGMAFEVEAGLPPAPDAAAESDAPSEAPEAEGDATAKRPQARQGHLKVIK